MNKPFIRMRTAHRTLLFPHVCSITYAPHFSSVCSWCCQEEASERRKRHFTRKHSNTS